MDQVRPYSALIERLRAAGLRPTRQRLALARLLFEGGDRHLTAEQLHSEARSGNLRVSLATVYNTLHQFTDAGLMREIIVESGRSYFDTNTSEHHHFFDADSAELSDIPGDEVVISRLPAAPSGRIIERVDVVVRVRNRAFGPHGRLT
ncbi:MAG: transcriptional repressor [Proteobacteria bacterium]|nr:transcriptional repressor [Pseudomonadota bacterium]